MANYYAVNLCLMIEAENEADALQDFEKQVKAGKFDGGSLDVAWDFETDD